MESVFIEEIVTEIYHRLGLPIRSSLPYLIGMEDSIEFITSWLTDGSTDTADILTITGMGGIGKTTLARYVYGLHHHEFSASSIIEDIGRTCKRNGLLDLQKQLCNSISNTRSINIDDKQTYTSMIENVVARKKVFIVLDDIDSVDQLNALLGKQGFYPGSKIIITTKDALLTEKYATDPRVQVQHTKHSLRGLDEVASLKLLSNHAFKCNYPKEGYEAVSEKLVKYCKGHPLALTLIGEFLYDKEVTEWEEFIQRLGKEINPLITSKGAQTFFPKFPMDFTEILQESSSSSNHDRRYDYDVFLSFQGADTGNGFSAHRLNALKSADLSTFYDDEYNDTKPQLEGAIKASRASIIVLSKNYASSIWCLKELVLILYQQRKSYQIVIPIFYHVEPAYVWKLQSIFEVARAAHIHKIEGETDSDKRNQWAHNMELWKNALVDVANLKGKDAKGRNEPEFIDEIVSDIYLGLGLPLRSIPPHLIGRNHSIHFISSWLTDGSSHSADILTIIGVGGIGKTALAKYVYELHHHEFPASRMIEEIGRTCTHKFNGLLDLQKQLCDGISNTGSIQVHDKQAYTSMIENAVTRKKVFIVLDDIDKYDQLHALLGKQAFHPGSKIIITTRDVYLTMNYAPNPRVQPKRTEYSLYGLDEVTSLKLLSNHAFKCNHPKEGYEAVSKELVTYCSGHPLALKVLGVSLKNLEVTEWEEYMQMLKEKTDIHTMNALQVGFLSLPFRKVQELFKNIACFFVGTDRDYVGTILKACGFQMNIGIKNLMDRCLLGIDGRNNTLTMHQLLQEMGKDLVRQESRNKPWKRSRLWCHGETFKVLKQKKGMKNLLGLILDMRMLEKEVNLCGSFEIETEAFSKMDNLMLLQLNYVHLKGSYETFPQELRWLCMHGFPLKTIPLDLPMKNLVALDVSYSKIESFDMSSYSNPQPNEKRQKHLTGSFLKDKRLHLGSLKILNLSFCEQLRSLGGFRELPALERLIVRECIGLVEVCESIEQCVELVFIDLSHCYNLKKIPSNLGKLKKLETLLLEGFALNELNPVEIGERDSTEVLKS